MLHSTVDVPHVRDWVHLAAFKILTPECIRNADDWRTRRGDGGIGKSEVLRVRPARKGASGLFGIKERRVHLLRENRVSEQLDPPAFIPSDDELPIMRPVEKDNLSDDLLTSHTR